MGPRYGDTCMIIVECICMLKRNTAFINVNTLMQYLIHREHQETIIRDPTNGMKLYRSLFIVFYKFSLRQLQSV